MNEFYGYDPRIERVEELVKNCLNSDYLMSSTFTPTEPPRFIDPRTWHRIENQGGIGSCQGHMQASMGEGCYWVATNGKVTQFSNIYAYYKTQQIDGLSGRDVGSTLSGGLTVVKNHGLCPLDVMPYPSRYSWNVPREADKAAADYKIKTGVVLRSERELFNFLATGQGFAGMGIMWNNINTTAQGTIERYNYSGGGGHAVGILGYSERRKGDRPYYWVANSWSERWGNKGWAEWSPDAMDEVFRGRYNTVVGYSDLESPHVRKIPNHMPW